MNRIWLGLALLLTLSVPLWGQNSQGSNSQSGPVIVDRDATLYGRGYSEWDAEWQQWADSIPIENHPLFDNGDCSVGQSGPVWFLGGKFCPAGTSCSATFSRSCTIPSSKAIFFTALDYEDSAIEETTAENPSNPDAALIGNMRSTIYNAMNTATAYAILDGVAIPNFQKKFRVQSPAFSLTLPNDDLWSGIYGVHFEPGPHYPAVDEGWFGLLPTLSPGHHVLQFGGNIGAFNFSINATYFLNVTR